MKISVKYFAIACFWKIFDKIHMLFCFSSTFKALCLCRLPPLQRLWNCCTTLTTTAVLLFVDSIDWLLQMWLCVRLETKMFLLNFREAVVVKPPPPCMHVMPLEFFFHRQIAERKSHNESVIHPVYFYFRAWLIRKNVQLPFSLSDSFCRLLILKSCEEYLIWRRDFIYGKIHVA